MSDKRWFKQGTQLFKVAVDGIYDDMEIGKVVLTKRTKLRLEAAPFSDANDTGVYVFYDNSLWFTLRENMETG